MRMAKKSGAVLAGGMGQNAGSVLIDGAGTLDGADRTVKRGQGHSRFTGLTRAERRIRYREARARRAAEYAEVKKRCTAHLLSFGGGVQSTASLLMFHKEYDYVLFADPGAEKPSTYEHIEKRIKPFCKEKGLKFVTVRHRHETLEEHCRRKHVIPLRTRRWCTTDWKIRPMHRFYKTELGATAERPVLVDLGISQDEWWRASNPDTVPYEWRNYPLVDREITREQCLAIIKQHGWPRPEKSACDFCPYGGKDQWVKLRAENPKRFEEIVEMEEQGGDYPRTRLARINLRGLLENAALTDFGFDGQGEESHECNSGYCFT